MVVSCVAQLGLISGLSLKYEDALQQLSDRRQPGEEHGSCGDPVHSGAYFEWTGSTSTMKKYYLAGGARIAIRTGSSTLNFILTDHLGSTSVTTDSNGAQPTDNRYKAWGESRFASGTLPTRFTYTGQYSNEADFGLMYYGARWYDSALSRFAQADTLIPQPGDSQAWDRYAYTLNNPLKYIDPTGHDAWWCQTNACQATHYAKLGYGKKVSGKVINPEKQNRRKDDIPAFEWNDGSPNYAGYEQSGTSDSLINNQDQDEWANNVGAMAIVLDNIALGFNGVYAMVGDAVGIACPECYPFVLAAYRYYSFIPNSVSTISMGLWVGQGFITGENHVSYSQNSEVTAFSLSISQDSIVASTTNAIGWIIPEPNLATALDAAVVVYDYGRSGLGSLQPIIPSWINPNLSYTSQNGFGFWWHR